MAQPTLDSKAAGRAPVTDLTNAIRQSRIKKLRKEFETFLEDATPESILFLSEVFTNHEDSPSPGLRIADAFAKELEYCGIQAPDEEADAPKPVTAPATAESPEWIEETPEETSYNLTMFDEGGAPVQDIELTRDEYIKLKRVLARVRGFDVPEEDEDEG